VHKIAVNITKTGYTVLLPMVSGSNTVVSRYFFTQLRSGFLIALACFKNKLMNSFFLKIEGKNKKILFSEILYVEAYKNYARIQTSKTLFTVHYTLKQIEESIPSTLFIKIHKSFIVALDKISEFDGKAVYIDKMKLPLSAQFAAILRSKLNIVHCKQATKLKVDKDGSLISGELNPGS